MMKKFIFLAIAIVFSSSLFAQYRTITIKGSVKFDEPRFKMEIYTRDGSEKKILASFDIDTNNKFEYKLEVKEAGVYFLDCKKWESVKFWAEDEDIEVNFRGMDTAKIKIKNPPYHIIENAGPKNRLMNELNFIEYRNYQMMIALSKIGYEAKFATDSDKQTFMANSFNLINEDLMARKLMLVEEHYKVPSVVSIFGSLKPGRDDVLIAKIKDAHKGYAPLEKILKEQKEAAENAARVELGRVAPDFAYSTPDGKKLGAKDFRGKLLLIDFWASWCGPCRGEIPYLKKYYDQFKDKGVEFLSVSIDAKDADWRKALDAEQMAWTQVLAPNAGKEIAKLYQFSGIPFIILIDKDGKIVEKHLRGENIKKAIEKHINQ